MLTVVPAGQGVCQVLGVSAWVELRTAGTRSSQCDTRLLNSGV